MPVQIGGRNSGKIEVGAHFAPHLIPGTNLEPASYAGGACWRLRSPMRQRPVISSAVGQSSLSAPIKGAATQSSCFRNTWKCVITGSWSPRVCVCVCMHVSVQLTCAWYPFHAEAHVWPAGWRWLGGGSLWREGQVGQAPCGARTCKKSTQAG